MSYLLTFKESALDRAGEDYSRVKLDKEYRKILENVSRIIIKYIPIPELAVRGFILKCIRNEQLLCKIKVEQLPQLSDAEKKRFIRNVYDKLYEMLEKIIKIQSPENQSKLKEAIDKAYQFTIKEQIF